MEFPNIYKGNYRLLAIAPVILILVSLYYIPQLQLGVEFTGGTLLSFRVPEEVSAEEFSEILIAQGLDGDVKVFPTARGYQVEILLPSDPQFARAEELKEKFFTRIDDVERLAFLAAEDPSQQNAYNIQRAELDGITDEMFTLAQHPAQAGSMDNFRELRSEFLNSYTLVYDNYQRAVTTPFASRYEVSSMALETVSPTLSVHFLATATQIVIISAILSILLVFLFFRTFVPSLAIIIGAFSDIVIALGAMGFFGIPLTFPSFAALLMLVGYSLDTDIMLTMRMLRQEGTPRDNAYAAMKTGTTMTLTGLIAFGVLFLLSLFTHIPTYFEISSVALVGLIGDLFATWGINALLMLWHVERSSHASA